MGHAAGCGGLLLARLDAHHLAASSRSLLRRGPWSAAPGGRLAIADARLAWWIILGSIPAAVLGYLFEDFFESLFSSPAAVGGFLLVTALILAISERLGRRVRDLAR